MKKPVPSNARPKAMGNDSMAMPCDGCKMLPQFHHGSSFRV